MGDFFQVLLFAAMPAVGNFLGGITAEMKKVSDKTLSLALHFAAGIMLTVVGIEIMPQALKVKQAWIPIISFVFGGIVFVSLDKVMGYVKNRFGSIGASGAIWGIYFGVAIDLFSDGIMIGTGSTIGTSLGLLLAVSQVPADIPEGFATIATFKSKGVSKKMRYILEAAFAIPILLGATIGYWAVRDSAEIIKFSLLAFTAGILFTASIEGIMSEAYSKPDSALADTSLSLGFALFAFLSVYLGG